jgi:hypothetical protein
MPGSPETAQEPEQSVANVLLVATKIWRVDLTSSLWSLCRSDFFVQPQSTIRALAQTLGSLNGLLDTRPPSKLGAAANDGDIAELTETPVASRTAHKPKQLRSVHVRQQRTRQNYHSGDAGSRSKQEDQRPKTDPRAQHHKKVAVMEAGTTQVLAKRHKVQFYY